MNYELLASDYYSDNPSVQKKAMDAGRYIDNHGMTNAGMANWLKYFDWWENGKPKDPKRLERFYNEPRTTIA